MTPSAAADRTSSTTSSRGRLISLPLTAGTMQNAQALSQPIWMVTHPAQGTSRRTGSAEGKEARSSATVSSRISTTGRPVVVASCEQVGGPVDVVGAQDDVDVGRSLTTPSRSFWARHPATTICIPGRWSLTDFRWPRVP